MQNRNGGMVRIEPFVYLVIMVHFHQSQSLNTALDKVVKAVTFLRSSEANTGYCVGVLQVIRDLYKLREVFTVFSC
jgi:hypothetical protein